MRRILACLLSIVPALAHGAVARDWVATADIFGNMLHERLTLEVAGDTVTGKLGDDKLEGTVKGSALHFVAKSEDGSTVEVTGTIGATAIAATMVRTDADDPRNPIKGPFSARPLPARRPGPPKRHEFTPTTFYRAFSSETKPVLTVWPGDTIHTTTVDAGGSDERGVVRVLGGNPQTGPFYVETAMPGDVLVVRLVRVRLNRDYAVSDDAIVGRALGPGLAVKMKDGGKTIRWRLDRERGVATPETPPPRLKAFTVPVRPMLGCIGVAPGFASAAPPTGDNGRYGGNMDFNENVEGATVYLPVAQPGALLYVGDGHALQGDGELNGNALETSMEVELTVDVIPQKRIGGPRVESATHVMALGYGGSLEDSLRFAIANLAQWLEDDYKLTPSEAAQVMGAAVEIKIAEVADRNAGVMAAIAKARLATLPRAAP
jgi:acetamidase/formamidase